MANLKEIDVDKVVKRVRELAEEHGWCEVADEALIELGFVENNKLAGSVTVQIPIEELTVPAGTTDVDAWVKKNLSFYTLVEDQRGGNYDVYFDDNVSADGIISVDLKAGGTVPGPTFTDNWKYATSEGRVKHWFVNPSTRNYQTAACGVYSGWGGLKDTSPRGENRKCIKCSTKHPNN